MNKARAARQPFSFEGPRQNKFAVLVNRIFLAYLSGARQRQRFHALNLGKTL